MVNFELNLIIYIYIGLYHIFQRTKTRPRTKNSRSRGYTVGYSPRQYDITLTYIEKSRNITPTKKEQKSPERHLGKKNLDQCLIRIS